MMSDNSFEPDEEIEPGFEERADHVPESVLTVETVTGDWFDGIYKALVARGTALIVGPRGCGKTHMMRYAWVRCCTAANQPLAIYVSFNRYLRLEPLLKTRSDALSLFQIWVLCRILLAADETVRRIQMESSEEDVPHYDVFAEFTTTRDDIHRLVTRLERAAPLSQEEEELARPITIEAIVGSISALNKAMGRRRAVVLLDDAALLFTQEFMVEFLDVVRVLKRTNISPKCSVYPGSTEYGPRFHADHEAQTVPAWLPVDHHSYRAIMSEIGQKRFAESEKLNKDVRDLLMYASFGIPRAYLTMLREMLGELDNRNTAQAALNKVIQSYRDGRLSEFKSLGLKMPTFRSIIEAGEQVFEASVNALKIENEAANDGTTKQILLGISADEITAIPARMIKLLVEAGLFFETTAVSHGPKRSYRRFIPHLAALIAARAFAERSRGSSSSQTVAFLERRPAKHPLRRSLQTLLPTIAELHFDLPPCQNCNAPRISDDQRFCHQCGSQLADDSTFATLMKLPISEVTNLSEKARKNIQDIGIKTIGELLAYEDPGSKLRQIHMVGQTRAEQYIQRVEAYIDEFLS